MTPNRPGDDRLEFLWVELTGSCNLECVHCYTDSGPGLPVRGALDRERLRGVIDEAAALGCARIQFIGGEPTLHPDLAELIAHARRAGIDEVAVYTNGTRLTDELRRVIVEQRVGLAFSVYGPDAAVHDAVTRRKGSFAKTMDSVRWALQQGLSVRVGVIAMDANRAQIEPTVAMLRRDGVRQVDIDRTRGVGRGAATALAGDPLHELCGRCGNDRLAVDHAGRIHPCVFSRSTDLGAAVEGGLAAALHGAARRDFQERLIDAFAVSASTCTPERPAPPCTPERDPGPCNPEIDPGPCTPEKPSICNPEIPQPPCAPEKPSYCVPEIAKSAPNRR